MKMFLFVLDVAEDVLHFAVERKTERIQRFGTDGFAVFDTVDRVGGKALLVNQIVFRQSLAEQCPVQRFVTDHSAHLSEILAYLTS